MDSSKSPSCGLRRRALMWQGTRILEDSWRWKLQDSQKRWYPTTSLYDVTAQKITPSWRHRGPPKRWYPATSLHGAATQRPVLDRGIKVLRTLVSYHNTTRCHDPEDGDLNLHRGETLKSPFMKFSNNMITRICNMLLCAVYSLRT
jgi:hypothetical protein